MQAIEAGQAFIDKYFPECLAAFLAGSVIRGKATSTSDLDIVIITNREGTPYRESFFEFGWPIEAFVNNSSSYRDFFFSNIKRRRPSLPMMCVEGIILRDADGLAQSIKAEAQMLLEHGPEPLSQREIIDLRYEITDLLDDFVGSEKLGESFFVANDLAVAATNLILGYHRRWIGRGKWVLRALREFDPHLAQQLALALENFYQRGEKESLINFAKQALQLVGGRLFEGYSAGKDG
jgi:hypothetical protein